MSRKIFTCALLVLLYAVLWNESAAQQKSDVPLLERTISVVITNEPLDATLRKIGQAAGFSFSYKSSIIDRTQRVSYRGADVTVREVLDVILNGNYSYRQKGNHIILAKLEKQSSSRIIDGYISDDATGRRLKNVSVYDPATMSSAVTDAYGYFRLEIRNPTSEEIRLAINKRTYIDTVVIVDKSWKTLLKVPIRENARRISTLADSVGHRLREFWLDVRKSSVQAANLENIHDTLHRKHQVGVLPFAGTNGKLSGNVVNDYSFNVLGGYSHGNNKLEFGGLFNINRADVNGVQVAGLFNAAGGTQRGVFLAGLVNAGLADQRGASFAGLMNFSMGDAGPLQMAGLINFSAGSVRGAQVGGLINFATDEIFGAQVSGLINIAPKKISGAQLSGLINVAREVDGLQLGVINYTSRIKGVPVGFMSIVAHGYHKIEFSADEVFYTNLAFRTGVRQFYNIFTVAAVPHTFDQPVTTWAFGYGVGTAPKLSKKVFLNFDLTSSQIVMGPVEEINLLNKLYVGVDVQVAKAFSITAGLTLNGQVTDSTYDKYPNLFADYQPDILYERDFGNNLNLRSWLGGKIGVRFL